MLLLDRYIARQYFINVVALLTVLCCFVVAIDVSLNLDRFHRIGKELAAINGEPAGTLREVAVTALVIADLWWPRLLQLFNFLIGIVMVGAMGFTCTQLVRNREFIAILAAGISLHRIIRPVMIVALGLSALQVLNQELIIPRIAPLLIRKHDDAGSSTLGPISVGLMADGSGRVFHASAFDPETNTIEGLFTIDRPGGRVIRADRATWDGARWVLDGGVAEPRRGGDDGVRAEPTPVAMIETSLDPNRIRLNKFREYQNALSFLQTGRMLARDELLSPEARAQLTRIRWGRFSVIAANLLALMIALPFFATRLPGNAVQQTLKCAPVAITALMGGVLGASAAIPGLPPAIGVFVPVLILAPLAVASLSAMKT